MRVKKKGGFVRVLLNIIYWAFFSCLVFVMVNQIIDEKTQYKSPLFGHRVTVIVTPSMETVHPANESYITPEMKRIKVNDTIVTKVYASFDEIQIYDIATYYKDGVLICHRVIDKYISDGRQYIIFRGDANNADDPFVEYSQVRGKVISITSGIGNFLLFVQTLHGRLIIGGSLLAVYFLVSLLVGYKKEDDNLENSLD